MDFLKQLFHFFISKLGNETCHLMEVPVEVRSLIYKELSANDRLKFRLVSRKCQNEIDSLFNFKVANLEVNDEYVRPCEMKLTVEFCATKKLWKPQESLFTRPIHIETLMIYVDNISRQNLNLLLRECSPHLKKLIVLITCAFNNTQILKLSNRLVLTLLKDGNPCRGVAIDYNNYHPHPDSIDEILETIALYSGKLSRLNIDIHYVHPNHNDYSVNRNELPLDLVACQTLRELIAKYFPLNVGEGERKGSGQTPNMLGGTGHFGSIRTGFTCSTPKEECLQISSNYLSIFTYYKCKMGMD